MVSCSLTQTSHDVCFIKRAVSTTPSQKKTLGKSPLTGAQPQRQGEPEKEKDARNTRGRRSGVDQNTSLDAGATRKKKKKNSPDSKRGEKRSNWTGQNKVTKSRPKKKAWDFRGGTIWVQPEGKKETSAKKISENHKKNKKKTRTPNREGGECQGRKKRRKDQGTIKTVGRQ